MAGSSLRGWAAIHDGARDSCESRLHHGFISSMNPSLNVPNVARGVRDVNAPINKATRYERDLTGAIRAEGPNVPDKNSGGRGHLLFRREASFSFRQPSSFDQNQHRDTIHRCRRVPLEFGGRRRISGATGRATEDTSVRPTDHYQDLRSERGSHDRCRASTIECHHHRSGPGLECAIDQQFDTLGRTEGGANMMMYKIRSTRIVRPTSTQGPSPACPNAFAVEINGSGRFT